MIAALLLEKWDVSDRPSRGSLRVLTRHPVGFVLLDEKLVVKRELATQLFVGGAVVEEGAKTLLRDAVQAGGCHARSSNKPTADDSRFQDSSSRSSWRLPSRVSV